MPVVVESSNKPLTSAMIPEVTDAEWLLEFEFRHNAPAHLAIAARQGDLPAWTKALPAAYDAQCRIGKRERNRVLGSLATLWKIFSSHNTTAMTDGSLAYCLFDRDLTSDELSGRVEAIITSTATGRPDRETLIAAHWLLRLSADRLESQTCFTLFRWAFDHTREWLKQAQSESTSEIAEQGCEAFNLLELQTLHQLCLPGLKGEKKQIQQVVKGWRAALDAITDGDGTPHSRWLGGIIPRYCQLAAVSLFADLFNTPLWDKKSRTRLEGLLARTTLLLSPERVAFSNLKSGEVSGALLAISEILHLSVYPGLMSLLANLEKQSLRPRMELNKNGIRGRLPKVSLQSDWAEWGCLRSTWPSPVSESLVRYESGVPQLETLVEDLSLFSGAWSHELKFNGQSIPSSGEWTCCCWYLDRQCAFMELQLNRDNPVQVIRQILLLREESVLMLSDSIRTPESGTIELNRTLPMAEGWTLEQDTLSRELALQQQATRIRVFPWTGPQMRVNRSDESVSLNGNQLRFSAQATGRGLYTSTLFDWSEKRREDPVDWQRMTVAEDGKAVSPDESVGFRLRIGKKQWMLYHSLHKPAIPRTVLGLHTLSETVFARLTSLGDVDALVEVEL